MITHRFLLPSILSITCLALAPASVAAQGGSTGGTWWGELTAERPFGVVHPEACCAWIPPVRQWWGDSWL